MKVTGKTINENETSVELDLFEGRKLSKAVKDRVRDEVGNYLVEQTLKLMDQSKSPVQGASDFPALSPEYKLKKKKEVGSTRANLEYDGEMKDELDFRPTKDGVEIGVYGTRAPAADGHNNLSGKSKLPRRQFLPDEGQAYKKPLQKEIERIIADAIAEETTFKKSMFKDVETKTDLYSTLRTIFGEMTRSELSASVFRNEELTNLLEEMDLLRLL